MVPVVGGVAVLVAGAMVVVLAVVNATTVEILLVAAVGVFGVVGLAFVGARNNGKVPYIALLGWGTFAVAGFVEWSILLPLFPAGGKPAAQHWSALAPIPVMMVCPIIIYLIAAWAARRRQIPLKMQFAAVPPE